MFNSRTLWLLLIALIMAVAATLTAKRLLTTAQRPAQQVVNTRPVVVAKAVIPKLSKIKESDVRVMQYPKDDLPFDPSLPEGGYNFIDDTAAVVGRIVTQTLYPGEPLVKPRLRDDLGGGPLAHVVTLSQRAVAVRVNDVTGIAGFLTAGDLVDVLHSVKSSQSDAAQTVLVAQAVKVLAVDQDASEERDKPVVVKAVTLEMSPQQAVKTTQAMTEGTIQLALRNPLDAATVPLPASKAMAAAPDAAAAASPGPPVVLRTLIKGGKLVEYRCNRAGCAEGKKQ